MKSGGTSRAGTGDYGNVSSLLGHHDGCAPDEWVGYEYAKTYRHYALQDLGDLTEIEYFDGPHTINGEGTFSFLRKHLRRGAG